MVGSVVQTVPLYTFCGIHNSLWRSGPISKIIDDYFNMAEQAGLIMSIPSFVGGLSSGELGDNPALEGDLRQAALNKAASQDLASLESAQDPKAADDGTTPL